MQYNTVLFDLDGTLTDPAEGIVNSIIYSLNRFKIVENDYKKLHCFIGPPLAESYSKYYGFSEEEAYRAVDYYREYYADKGIFENKLYPGIVELLIALKSSGKNIALATSKPEVYAKRILEHFNISSYFDFLGGSNLDGSRVVKSEVIQYVLSSLKPSQNFNAIMVGDREHDIVGANKNKIDSVGVLYGYGSRQELKDAGATYIISSIESLQGLLLK